MQEEMEGRRKKNGLVGRGEERCPRVGLGQGGRYIWQRRSGDGCGRNNKEEERKEGRKCKGRGGERAKARVAQKHCSSSSLDEDNALDNGRDPIKVLQHTLLFASMHLAQTHAEKKGSYNGHAIHSGLQTYSTAVHALSCFLG